MKLKVLFYLLCAFGLYILPAFCQGNGNTTFTTPTLIIRLTHGTQMILPHGTNSATIELLSQNVTLETNNDTGIWQRPDNTNTTDSRIYFPIFTANFAGLYSYYITNQNGDQMLGIQIYISVSGTKFAQLLSTGDYEILNGNNIFYTNTTLVCATNDTSQQIQWTHQSNLDSEANNVTELSTTNYTTGISTLDIMTSTQGYYTCTPIPGETNYIVAIFDPDNTIVAREGESYTFTKGIDPSDIQLLCVTVNNIPLIDISWNSPTPLNQNPINIDSLTNKEHTLTCNMGTSSTFGITLLVQGPPTIILSNGTQTITFSTLPPDINTANIIVLTNNSLILTGLTGRWDKPDNSSTSSNAIHFPYFTVNYAGLYSFYVTGWNKTEVLAIQMYISATGANFAEVTSSGLYSLLSGNNIFYTNTTLVCATNDTSQQIQWTHQSNLDSEVNSVTELSTANDTTGISTLDIMTSTQGYYTCTPIPGDTNYMVAIFDPDITIVAKEGESYTFTRGIDPSDLQLLCVTDNNTPLTEISWNSPTPLNQNPISIDSLTNMQYTLTCNMGTSSTFDITLLVQGPPTIILSIGTQTITLSTLPPGINTADIIVLTNNSLIQTGLTGRWDKPDNSSTYNNVMHFPYFTVNYAGLYSFYVTGWNKTEVLAIQIYISATGSSFAEETSSGAYEVLSGNNIFYTQKVLVCATNYTSQEIEWTYRKTQDGVTNNLDFFVNWTSISGLSRLKTIEAGYYTCVIQTGGASYTSALLTQDITIAATNGMSIIYTKFIDRYSIQLLCTTTDSSIPLNNIRWNVSTPNDNNNENPVILNNLNNDNYILNCNGGTSGPSFNVILLIQGPPKITLSGTELPSNVDTADIRVLTQNFTLQTNLMGMWYKPDSSLVSDNPITYSVFTANLRGSYIFYVNNWKGNQVVAKFVNIFATGSNFAEKLSSGVYKLLSGNNIFYASKTLVCVTNDTSQEIEWIYHATQDGTAISKTTDANFDTITGISELSIITTGEGYYTCDNLSGGTSYTAAIFNPDITIVATNGMSIVYTKFIDTYGIQLLCTTTDSNIPLNNIRWNVSTPNNNNNENPVILRNLNNANFILNCNGGTLGPSFDVNLLIQGPPIITLSGTGFTSFVNTADIRVLTQDVTIQANLIGMWEGPDGSLISDNPINYSVFTANLAGLYAFNVINWEGNQVVAISVTLSATGSNFAESLSPGDYKLLSGNNIFYASKTLVCVTNDTSQEIEWTYQATQDGTAISKTTDDNFDTITGISELSIITTEQGYYTCDNLFGGTSYTVAIFNPDITVVATSAFHSYIRGIDPTNIQLLCNPEDTAVDLSTIKLEYSGTQYNNPLIYNEAGSINGLVKCLYGSSAQLSFILIIIEPSVTLTYPGYSMQYNMLSPSIIPITIPLFSNDLKLTIGNIVTGEWNLPRSSKGGIRIAIPIFTLTATGIYTYNSSQTWDGIDGEVFRLDISPTGNPFAVMESVSEYTPQSNNPIFYTDTTLVCLTDYSTQVMWFYKERTQAQRQAITSPNTDTNGISTHMANLTKPGLYSCEGLNYASAYVYTAGVFDKVNTRVAMEGGSYSYTIGIDSEEAELLCDLNDSSVDLNTVEWFRKDVLVNPLDFSENLHLLTNGTAEIKCYASAITDIRLTANLTIQDLPVIKVGYLEETTSFTLSQSDSIHIPLLINNTVISSNLINGMWRINDTNGTTEYGDNIEYRVNLFTANNIGVYQYVFSNFYDGEEIIEVTLSGTGSGLGMESDDEITTVKNNTIFYQDTLTLVAASNKRQIEASDIVWTRQDAIADTLFVNISSATIDLIRSISRLNLSTLSNGYYSVAVKDADSTTEQYVVGVFKTDYIYDTREMRQIQYTSGVDSVELQILCIPPTYSILANIQWIFNSSLNFTNPVRLQELTESLGEIGNATLKCVDSKNLSIEFETVQITIRDPPIITLKYSDETETFVGILENNEFQTNIQVFTQKVIFKCNKQDCMWSTYNATSKPPIEISGDREYIIPIITIQNNITYLLSTKDNSGQFVPSVFISITTIGTSFQRLIRNGSEEVYQTVITNSIINLEENVTLTCVTSYVSVTEEDIKWFFQEPDLSEVESIDGKFNNTMGLSLLSVNKAGFYTCQVPDESRNLYNYSVGVYSIANQTMEISFDDLQSSRKVDFVLGEELKLYYQDETIRIQAIRWGIQRTEAEESSFLREYFNPVDVNKVFNEFGSGAFKFSCFFRQSPMTIVGDVGLNLKDTASLTVQYDQVMKSFNDKNNSMFPEPEMISIPIVTKEVNISCSLSSCVGQIEKDGDAIDQLIIASVTIENAGTYAVKRTTGDGVEYSTALVSLIVTGFMEQSIALLNASVINETSAYIFWELQNQLPDNSMETFYITYGGMDNIIQAGNTTDLNYTLTGLTPGVEYTIWVKLSYAYTTETSNKSVEVSTPLIGPPPLPLLAAILIVLFIIVVLIIVIVVLIVICIVLIRRKKGRKFQTLESDEVIKSKPTQNRLSQGYAPIEATLDNPMFNPHLTESLLEKPKFIETVKGQNENYQNLQEIKNPRMKPIPLDLFKQTVDKLWENENTLEEEYKSLGVDAHRYECGHAQIEENRIKNKYKSIYPYDKSRVMLAKLGKDPNSEYINASHIPGLYVTQNFIAAQGPKENTIQDLWRMVLEKDILNIVMVTNCVEGGKLKCEEYFPLKEGKTMEFGKYKVRNISTNQSKGHVTRTLNVTFDKQSTQVKHFHFTAWPDHDVPSLFDELLEFVGFVQNNITEKDAPILVHCSAGVGRTGTFITLFNLRHAIQKGEPISIYQLVHEMREHRPHMVQTFRQYKFIYLAVLELLLDKISIPAGEFNSTYSKYLESDQEGYVSIFFQQFSELNYQCEKSFILSCSEGENNENKNPNQSILPFDNNRVVIYSPHFPANYINASYHENNLFITAQNPIANTVCDFLQMIYQTEATLVILLTTPKEKSKILANMSDRKPYWPNKEGTLNVPPFQVEVVSSEKSTAMIKQKVTLRNVPEKSERTFVQVISTTWNDKNDPSDIQSVVTLIHLILKHRQDNPNTTIIMHCNDSITKTGVVFAVYQCIRDMQETGEVDIFHTIKRLRRERMNIIPNLSNFLSCYALMNEYCSSI